MRNDVPNLIVGGQCAIVSHHLHANLDKINLTWFSVNIQEKICV